MTTTAKALLRLTIVCLGLGAVINLGWIDLHGLDAFYAVLPTGAVFLGMFLIVLVLENQTEMDDDARHVNEPADKRHG